MLSQKTCSSTTGAAQQIFTSALSFFAASQCLIPDNTKYNEVPECDTFDFIIVGGGSAGCVVASRLSEISHWNVLLLEAGPEPPIESEIPYLDYTLIGTKYDWQYLTKADGVSQQGLKYGAVPWPRGKMLGGSSSINAMIYVRGRDNDFQAWSYEGNPSWSPERVNYYFKKAENLQDMNLNKDVSIYKTYGHSGPLIVNTYNYTFKDINQKILDSWDHIGIKTVPDINTAKYHGYGLSGITRVTATNGQRQSTYLAYLQTAKNRNNLKIVTNAFVTKVLINKNSKAYGVEVDIAGKRKIFFANLEVILSAGSINTPQLLMLSGVGPEEHLLLKNISSKVNLPNVGKNLQDHLSIYIPIYTDEPGFEDTATRMFEVVQYLYNKTGYLAHGGITGVLSFYSRNELMSYPEFESHSALYWRNSSVVRQYLNIFKDEVLDSFIQYNSEKALHILSLNLLHPFSRGSICLNTSNPYDHPIIDANYFGDKRDIDATVAGIQTLTELVTTPYFESINAFIPKINLPQCNQYEFLSDLYWRCYAIQMTTTIYHPVGTTKMGPDPKDSVVNNFLKVHGVESLRVIDAGIMSFITSGNTNAPTIMIGEMGADMIKADNLPQ